MATYPANGTPLGRQMMFVYDGMWPLCARYADPIRMAGRMALFVMAVVRPIDFALKREREGPNLMKTNKFS